MIASILIFTDHSNNTLSDGLALNMKKIITLSAIALAVLSGCGTTTTTPVQQNTALLSDTLVISPNDNREYKTLKLANNIEVILVSDPKGQSQTLEGSPLQA